MRSRSAGRRSAGLKSAAPMVDRCFRHQHPEAFGRWPALHPLYKELQAVVEVPDRLAGRDQRFWSGSVLAEERMGWAE